ncbi:hypothetical protein JCM18750_38840 [Halostagnicola bangensis]
MTFRTRDQSTNRTDRNPNEENRTDADRRESNRNEADSDEPVDTDASPWVVSFDG